MVGATSRASLLGLLLAVGAGAAFAAQAAFFAGQREAGLAWGLCALVLAAFHGARVELPATAAPAAPGPLRPERPRVALFAVGAGLLLLGLQALDRADVLQFALLFVAIAALLLAYGADESIRQAFREHPREAWFLAGVTVVALIARIAWLDRVPGGLYGDEGEFGLVGIPLLEGERLRPFAVAWDHHPTLFGWLQAGAMAWLGETPGAIRLPPAIAGGLTVIPLYVLLRTSGSVTFAAAGAVLLAISPWHIHFTRIASNNAFVGLFTVGVLAALVHGARSGRARPFVAMGAMLGLAFYFGNKAVGVPPMLAGGAFALLLTQGRGMLGLWRQGLFAVVIALLVLLPQLVYYAGNEFYGPLLLHPLRSLIGSEGDPTVREGGWLAIAWKQIEVTFLTFHLYSDRGLFNVRGGVPLLAFAEGAFYLVGLGLSLAFAVRMRPLSALLLVWFAIGLGGALLDKKPVRAHHLIGMIPVPVAFAAMALEALRRELARWVPGRAAAVLIALVVGATAVTSARTYFVTWARGWRMVDVTELGRAMHNYDAEHQLVMVTPQISWGIVSTMEFMARDIEPDTVLPQDPLDPRTPWFEPTGEDVVFIVLRHRSKELPAIRRRYPDARTEEVHDTQGRVRVTLVHVPHADVVAAQARLREGGSGP